MIAKCGRFGRAGWSASEEEAGRDMTTELKSSNVGDERVRWCSDYDGESESEVDHWSRWEWATLAAARLGVERHMRTLQMSKRLKANRGDSDQGR